MGGRNGQVMPRIAIERLLEQSIPDRSPGHAFIVIARHVLGRRLGSQGMDRHLPAVGRKQSSKTRLEDEACPSVAGSELLPRRDSASGPGGACPARAMRSGSPATADASRRHSGELSVTSSRAKRSKYSVRFLQAVHSA